MKDKLFCKATALVMSSFMVFLGQASVIASNNQKITITDNALVNSKSIIAQGDSVDVGAAVAIAVDVLGDKVSIVETRIVRNQVPAELVPIVREALAGATTSFASAQSSAEKGEFANTATAIATGVRLLSDGIVEASSRGDTETAKALAEVVLSGNKAEAAALAASGS